MPPTCIHCRTVYYPEDRSSEAEPCECGACEAEYSWEDYEPTEDELEARGAYLATLVRLAWGEADD